MTYIFKSEITKAAMPLGVIGTHQVDRGEVSNYLEIIKKVTDKKIVNWGRLFVQGRIEYWDTWDIKTITRYLEYLQKDIEALSALLNVQNNPASLCDKPDRISGQVQAQIAPRIDVVNPEDAQDGGVK